MNWIDLTLPLTGQMPVYPGDPAVAVDLVLSHAADGMQLSRLTLGSHAGTHLDAPRHFIRDGASVADLPLDRLITPALVVGCPPSSDGLIHVDAKTLLQLHSGDALLLATGWEVNWEHPEYFAAPMFAPGTSDLLTAHQIKLLGVDLPTVTELRPVPDAAAMHLDLLREGIIIVENLNGLTPLIGHRIEFIALPLRIPGCDGSPVRALARVIDF